MYSLSLDLSMYYEMFFSIGKFLKLMGDQKPKVIHLSGLTATSRGIITTICPKFLSISPP